MSGIINSISSMLGRSAATPVVEVVESPVENKAIYSRNEKGWPSYNIEIMTKEQCDVAEKACRSEAGFERNRAIIDGIEGVALAIGIAVSAVIIAKLATLFFATVMINMSAHYAVTIQPIAFFTTKIVTHALTYIGATVLISKVWNSIYNSVQNHLAAARHLDDTGVQALLRAAALVSAAEQAPVVVTE